MNTSDVTVASGLKRATSKTPFCFQTQYPIAFCHKIFLYISIVLANHYAMNHGVFLGFAIAVGNPDLATITK